jgi:inorganic pyrophosphatase
MESIDRLLFGCVADVLAELLRPDERAGPDLAEQARRAGQWCASTPERVIIALPRLTADVPGMSEVLPGYGLGGPETAAPSKEQAMNIEVIVETPQGSRNKYEVDHQSGRIRLDRMLFTSTVYPLDYGFVEGTLAEDGDPLDALVWLDEPTFPGCLVTVRPVAVFWMNDEQGPDAKVLTVCSHDPRKGAVRELGDVPQHMLNEIGHFFDIYKELEPGKSTDVRGWMDRAEAERVIKESQVRTHRG